MKRRILSLILIMSIVFGISSIANAMTINAGSSSYTSGKQWGAPGATYHVELTSVSFTGVANNTFPYNGRIKAQLYYGGNAAGVETSFSSLGIKNPGIWPNYQNVSGEYKLRFTNSSSLNCSFSYNWNP